MEPHLSYLTENINFVDDSLSVDGISLESIANTFKTPTYVYSERAVTRAAKQIYESFSRHHRGGFSMHYSMKANSNFDIVRAILATGAGVDCVSAGEVFKALKCGCDPKMIVFAGVGKTREEIDFAVAANVGWFNVENEEELTYISDSATQHQKTVCVALRVNPNVKAVTNENIATGHKDTKFGLPMDTARSLLAAKDSFTGVRIQGIHIHIGSQLESVEETTTAVRIAVNICDEFGLSHINVGGGFPISYDGVPKMDVERFAAAVGPLTSGRHLMIEPGRRIVGASGLLLTRVVYAKKSEGTKTFAIVDASMTELMRPALYGKNNPRLHAILPVQRSVADDTTLFSIVGPVCETTDAFGEAELAKNLRPGTLLAIMTAGAYGFSMANNYNARPLPPQVIIRDGVAVLSTRRQTFEDLISIESASQ